MSLIEFHDFSFQYAQNAQSGESAVKNISLTVNEGEFLVICGRSGSGKSTLLRCMKEETTPAGRSTGSFVTALSSSETAVVFQDPDTQLVCSTVIEDLAFYMENLGYTRENMRHTMAETVGFFGIESLLHRDPNDLSGGQKQMVVLCAALMTNPRLLLLDEPVSQLDPIASKSLLDTLVRINRELGVAIVMTEHRLDDCIAVADKLAVMEDGKILCMGETGSILKRMVSDNDDSGRLFVPEIPKASYYIAPKAQVCLTGKELRSLVLSNNIENRGLCFEKESSPKKENLSKENLQKENLQKEEMKKLIKLKNIFFAYDESTDFVLRNLFLNIYKGERVCLMGGNGSGKTTLLKLICKIIRPLSGTLHMEKLGIAYMPQDVKSYFRFETVKEEIDHNRGGGETDEKLLEEMGLSKLLQRHPLDLSGGEAGKLALYCLLLKKSRLILMDEPTKGMDPYGKRLLAVYLKASGATVVCATHDLEFAAGFATRCVMLFDGSVSISSNPAEFFGRNHYYTTALSRAMRPLCNNIITFEDVKKLWI